MNNFEIAVNLTLEAEGILSNHKNDAGGITKYGISKTAYPKLDIANITKDDAINIYKKDYWEASKCDILPYPLDIMVFDTAVNHGVKKSIMILQESLECKKIDGIIGPQTLSEARDAKNSIYTVFMINRFFSYSEAKSWQTFKNGWKNRLVKLSKDLDI